MFLLNVDGDNDNAGKLQVLKRVSYFNCEDCLCNKAKVKKGRLKLSWDVTVAKFRNCGCRTCLCWGHKLIVFHWRLWFIFTPMAQNVLPFKLFQVNTGVNPSAPFCFWTRIDCILSKFKSTESQSLSHPLYFQNYILSVEHKKNWFWCFKVC